ncbi:mpv17-like protein isoform X1 [Ciconia boyciana]
MAPAFTNIPAVTPVSSARATGACYGGTKHLPPRTGPAGGRCTAPKNGLRPDSGGAPSDTRPGQQAALPRRAERGLPRRRAGGRAPGEARRRERSTHLLAGSRRTGSPRRAKPCFPELYLCSFKLELFFGMSILQRKEDIFSDCKKKFWNTYKTGLMYWPFVQLSNFILVPVYLRTAYTGLCGFVWATFICFSQQSGDGTAKSAFMWLQREKVNADEESSEK